VNETTVTSKGTTTIPNEIRQALAIAPGTILEWKVEGETIRARKKRGVLNELQKHIQTRAGSWGGNISGEELLKRTRP
jgi:AbrB family looped-hinge helix DNA binding protein